MTIDLGKQSDGFTITGSAQGDTITGSSAADIIDAGLGADTIVGFTTGDDVEGGGGTDTLTLAATSAGLNAAPDGELTGVEIVSAALAAAGVTIDLGKQSDGFTITGSAQGDTITGSTGSRHRSMPAAGPTPSSASSAGDKVERRRPASTP